MKHKLVILACALVVVATAVISINAYNNYQVHLKILGAQDAVNKSVHDKLQAAAVASEKRRLADECIKETAYYNALTPAQKAKMPAPECNLPIVQ